MLEQLRVENFVLVEKAFLDFHPGLNVLTGETGAGKSLVVEALGLLLGERASTQFIRTGAEKALVEGYFSCRHREITEVLAQYGLDVSAEDGLMLSREITKNGRNVCRVNGRIIPLNMFQAVGSLLVDIHGQNEQISLLAPDRQLAMLDLRGGEELLRLKEEVAALFREMQAVQRELQACHGSPEERERLQAYYQFQIEEIEKAQLQDGEEEALQQRKQILLNREKLMTGMAEAYDLLFQGARLPSAYDQLSHAATRLESLVLIDPGLDHALASIKNSLYLLEEAARELQNHLSRDDFDPGELEAVTQRLELIGDLKRKYGSTIKEILAYREEAGKKLEALRAQESRLQQWREDLEVLERDYYRKARELSQCRQQVALRLEEEMLSALKQLDMPMVQFKCHFETKERPGETGLDAMEFYFSPNLGEPLKPLAKIASGGEMARVMLALKAILADVESVETMVFDEADAGIGGITALKVGQKLAQIAKSRQVICITHSPQIASYGDVHFRLYKENTGGRTVTRIEALTGTKRVEELARMLGGGPEDVTAIRHAEELIKEADREKTSYSHIE